MKWKLKVWGGGAQLRGYQGAGATRHVVVAEYTQKAAVARLNAAKDVRGITSLYHFRGYFSETGNQAVLLVARQPGVWEQISNGHDTIMKELKA